MHLKSLILKGFKSFADRSVISLEPGITAVVGPNGSGKSNISDAVLWVLGERNAKNLRGQAMEDVIFAGSSARKSVGVAEVDLVLDNSDGTLPVEFNEVSLTRRMYRSGESEYLINGSPARRMDFLDILHDTGLGTGTHSIIGQGNLDAILASKPEDRRALIEEAAGVLKHKQRKERSARKLAAMDTHLARVKDVTAEVERQLKPLARKAQRAQAYQGIAEELAQLDLALAVDDLRTLQAQWDAALLKEKEAAAAIDLRRINVQEAEQKLEQFQRVLQEKGLYVGDLTAQRGRFHMVVERLESADMVLAEKERSIRARLEQAENTASGSARRIERFEDEVAQLKEALDEHIAKRDAFESRTAELSAELAEAQAQRKAADTELADVQALLRSRERERDAALAKRSRLQDGLSGQLSSKRLLESKQAETTEELAAASAELDERCRGLDEETQSLALLLEQSRAAAEEVSAAQRALRDAQQALDEARAEKQRFEGRIAALEELNRSVRSQNAASAWVSDQSERMDGALKPFAAEVRAPEELEPLVEHLLGEDLTGWLAVDGDAARNVVESLLQAGVQGSASVLYPGQQADHAGSDSLCAAPRLLDSLAFPESARATMERLLGDVVLVESIEQGLALGNAHPELRFALPNGVVIWPEAKISVHTPEPSDESLLARERQLEHLRRQCDEAREHFENAAKLKESCEADLERKRAMSLELSQSHAQRKGSVDASKAERERLAKRVGVLEASLASIADDLRRVVAQLCETEPEIAQLTETVEEAQHAREQLEERLSVLTGKRAVAAEKEQEIAAKLNEAKLQGATARERVLSLTREHRERMRDLERAVHAKERARRDLEQLGVAVARIQPLHETLSALKESAQIWVEDLASKAALEQSNSAALNDAMHDARQAARCAQEALDASTTALNEVRVEKGRLEVQVERAIAVIVEECNTPLETALEIPAPADRAYAEGEAFKLRRRLSSMGTIDSSAAEEYAAMKERYDFMAAQVEDMEAARRSLKRIVAAIDERMKNQFDVTFDQVNANFQRIFGQLFPGGTASLSLVNEDDPDHLGVEVNAQPRGKRITKMTLMSGGEKSLTAIALLFAVYSIRRTPFYILDEVEAALDDSNLRRLIAYLETLRHETQLILITHQRRTMEMSDVLYGVSMQADGVTKVVSQRLDRALKEAH